MNLIINLENDHWILSDPEQTLADAGAGTLQFLYYHGPWNGLLIAGEVVLFLFYSSKRDRVFIV